MTHHTTNYDPRLKTVAELIDEMITNNIKLFMVQDEAAASTTDEAIANCQRRMYALNARRARLMRALNETLGYPSDTILLKSYDK